MNAANMYSLKKGRVLAAIDEKKPISAGQGWAVFC